MTPDPSSPADACDVLASPEASAVLANVQRSLAIREARQEPADEAEREQAASQPGCPVRTTARIGDARLASRSEEVLAHPLSRPDVLTVEELAELLRLERKTVYACISRGEIPGVRRLGGAIRVHREAVLRWLAEGQGRTPRLRGSK